MYFIFKATYIRLLTEHNLDKPPHENLEVRDSNIVSLIIMVVINAYFLFECVNFS